MLVALSKIVIVCNEEYLANIIKEVIDLDVEVVTRENFMIEDKKMNLHSIYDMRNILDFYFDKNISQSIKSSKKNIKKESHLVKTKTKEYKRRITYDKSRY